MSDLSVKCGKKTTYYKKVFEIAATA